jgi:hypothetical protein
MKKAAKVVVIVVVAYIIASCVFSIGYTMADNKWDYRIQRNGLLCAEIAEDGFFIYSPFCNYGDVYLLGVMPEEDGSLYVFSDGFYGFGHWADAD